MTKIVLIVFGGLIALMAGGAIVAVSVYTLFTVFYGAGTVDAGAFLLAFFLGLMLTALGGAACLAHYGVIA